MKTKSLQAQMSKGVPSSRLLERARRLKQTADVLQKKVISELPDGCAERRLFQAV